MIPRPVILTEIVVPTGGWTFKFYLSDAAEYDHTVTVTIPAGTYFLSGDNQDDDLLFSLQTVAQAGIVGLGAPFNASHYIYASLPNTPNLASTAKKVRIAFSGFTGHPGNHIKLAWTECSASLVEALGFDSSADDTSSGADSTTHFIADYAHAFGWYSDEDGQLGDLNVYDNSEVAASQTRGPIDGRVKTCMLGSFFNNQLRLQWMSRALTYSDGASYGSAPPYPLTRNYSLECWWREARQGKRFRVYEHKLIYDPDGHPLSAQEVVTRTADSTTTLTDSSKSWTTNRWTGQILQADYGTWRGVSNIRQWFYIASNTSTVLTVANAPPDGLDLWVSAETFTIWEHKYQTYVVDLNSMKEFAPKPMARDLEYYEITIPLFRYVAAV